RADRNLSDSLAAVAAGQAAFVASRRGRAGPDAPPRWLWPTYGALTALFVAYALSVVARGGDTGSRLVDGWLVDGFELLTGAMCLVHAVIRRSGRAATIAFGASLIAWALGDLLVTLDWPPPSAAPLGADLSYLAFYPLALGAVVLVMRAEVVQLSPAGALDGVVAGIGVTAVCAAFAFHGVLGTAGNSLATAMALAYPIGDLVLFALVVAGTAVLADRNRGRWLLVALACSINAVGDTFNALPSSAFGETCNALAWPAAILLISASVWMRPSGRVEQDPQTQARFLLPGLAAVAGAAILLVGSLHPLGRPAIILGACTLAAVGVRLALSVGALHSVTTTRHHQSMTDDLTGLGNRRFLSHLVAVFFGEGQLVDRSLAVLFVDLDRFKEVNDAFGHAAGDELLRQIAPRLERSLRRGDVLVRLGGDEFAVVLPDADAAYATSLAERLTAALGEPFFLGAIPIRISASIGIAVAPDDATGVGELLACADGAMYRAKLARSAWAVYDGRVDYGRDPLRRAEELRAALGDRVERRQLRLEFQPQLDLASGSVVAAEALVRWEHPRFGTIQPLEFLPLAEDAGLMPALTARVLDEAAAQCARWHAGGHEVAISVNVSTSNLLEPLFAESVGATLRRHGLPAAALLLEITETCIISDYDRAKAVIGELAELGVTVSIDDFGAGFTSLGHLAGLAVGELKLDPSFVAGLAATEGEREVELLRSTIGLGHALGLRVVAEGVEDEETLELLGGLGCDRAQGYLIGRPVAAGAVQLGRLRLASRQVGAGG
ncbi:MAG TPA: bifunctional diguanylate cyclase/phosphodiesterase, partial [Acidimicrobiales bacterium]|nr:bifunctional diguanylate cyclase/phosphodiesterase [Acidimicrobiales bacterium]